MKSVDIIALRPAADATAAEIEAKRANMIAARASCEGALAALLAGRSQLLLSGTAAQLAEHQNAIAEMHQTLQDIETLLDATEPLVGAARKREKLAGLHVQAEAVNAIGNQVAQIAHGELRGLVNRIVEIAGLDRSFFDARQDHIRALNEARLEPEDRANLPQIVTPYMTSGKAFFQDLSIPAIVPLDPANIDPVSHYWPERDGQHAGSCTRTAADLARSRQPVAYEPSRPLTTAEVEDLRAAGKIRGGELRLPHQP
jgi:hypothetical protein